MLLKKVFHCGKLVNMSKHSLTVVWKKSAVTFQKGETLNENKQSFHFVSLEHVYVECELVYINV